MDNLKVTSFNLPQPPIVCVDFSEINSDIKKICFDLLNTQDKVSHSKSLAGNLIHQYIAPEKIQNHIKKSVPNIVNNDNLKLDSCWVNFQRKYEFNPNHYHDGDYSFVWWINIPYNLQEELSLEFVKNSGNPSASIFSFTYVDLSGMPNYYSIPLDKKDEGMLVLFPAKLTHNVYPFYTSDEYRISISGNLSYKK